ncbi:hypothetical protein TNIN_409341 [Trichonephila inaurata madagascariensis]|uniref:Uncharacterized protein n=1 Tax=Trichonephila inaurata madagascariensis TaxID=2747483 RepID=A0A8X7CQK4_9ARAC|nr:hypothetical protein TNIN_409341 [Trichonephila inaurata madagascariensis]
MDTLESLESKLRLGNWSDQCKDLTLELQEPEIIFPKNLTDSSFAQGGENEAHILKKFVFLRFSVHLTHSESEN